MIKVIVLGNGNLGTHMCVALEKSTEVLLLQNYNRKGEKISNCNVPIVSEIEEIIKADVYIFTFNDAALNDLKRFKKLNGIIVHTSGATPIDALKSFENHGVLYPIQSFRKDLSIDFNSVPIAIESNSSTTSSILKQLALSLSSNVSLMDSEQRLALHTAAVFANNFGNFMLTQAQEICKNFNIDFEVLKPLILDSLNKLENKLPSEIQTGPAIRNDTKTISKHKNFLINTDQGELYTILTKAIQNYYGKKL